MPSRILPELTNSLAVRLTRIEKELRWLRRRVRFPGRTRYKFVESVVTSNSTPSSGVVATSIDLEPGAWKIEARTQINPPQNASLTMIPWAYDMDGHEIDEINLTGRLGYAAWLSTVAGTFSVPLTVVGFGRWPEGGRIDLQFHAAGGASPLIGWEQVFLIAVPL